MNAKQHLSAVVRIILIILYILLQVAVLIVVFRFFRRQFPCFYAVCEGISFLVVLYIVREDINSTYKIPWIILNLVFPIWGGLAYLTFGHVRFTNDEKRRVRELARACRDAMLSSPDSLRFLPLEELRQSRYLSIHAGAPAFANTAIRYFPLGEDFFDALVLELEKAEKFIFLEYFIISPGKMWNTIQKILERKSRTGVDVRVVYDDIGCIGCVPTGFAKTLEQKGIACQVFNPFRNIFSARFNNRDHRKICVIDGNVAYTGGINLADEYINVYPKHGHWKDTAVELRGDAVWSLTVMFLSLWDFERKMKEDFSVFAPTQSISASGVVQPYTDFPQDGEYVGETVYRGILNQARNYVYIMTPYLVIDDEMIASLTTAAKSGVDVRIITPGIPDKKIVWKLTRSYYAVLLKAGVRIFEYTPGFIHAKEFVSDDRSAVVGTINLDYRSLCHHYECAVWMCNVSPVAEIKQDFLQTQTKCREITLDICHKECNRHPLLLSILRIFAPVF